MSLLEQEALMIRYRAAMTQLKKMDTVNDRFDLLADVVFPTEGVYNASIQVAQENSKVRTRE